MKREGYFDLAYYARQIERPLASYAEGLQDYLDRGWLELADPASIFSTSAYLDRNADVRASGQNPLWHYVTYGRTEGRPIERGVATPTRLRRTPAPRLPTRQDWESLALHSADTADDGSPHVDVVVPVYRGIAETLCCLFSVLTARGRTAFRLVVVDDHGPEPEIRERLAWLAGRGLIDLLRTPKNSGFVTSCNLGMAAHPARDVVLLNADTEVFDGWLDRLRAAAYRDPRTATVTPFSNNAEICSYPRFVRDNWLPLEIPDRELDAIMASVNAGGEVDLPTGVGFCLYLRRDCLDTIGLLNAETFGQGYGEENDLCRRAHAAGRRNILAADVFVRHYGGVSFGASKLARIDHAVRTVERLHPGYLAEIGAFVAADPVAPYRRAVDAERIARHCSQQGSGGVLLVQHNWGGGTDRHVREMAQLLQDAAVPVLIGCPSFGDPRRLEIRPLDMQHLPNAPSIDLYGPPEIGAEILHRLDVSHVHVQHLAGIAPVVLDYMRLATVAAGLHYDVTIHDYMSVCPRITFTDGDGQYCGEPDLAECQACIDRDGSPFGQPAVWEWRQRHERFLAGARRRFVPADDVNRRMRRYFPRLSFVTRPHLYGLDAPREDPGLLPEPPERDASLRVAILGAIGPHKGSALLLRCARLAQERALDIHFTVIGYTDRDDDLEACGNVAILGRYAEEALPGLIGQADPDLIWFPATWPETYSYTLSAALRAGATAVAFDFGAPAERIRAAGGHLMPIECLLDPGQILDHLLRLGAEPRVEIRQPPMVNYADPLRSYYDLPR
ncbi:glycosyl transferase [Methylobacterium haplocladii]|uniref:Glycosyl transferase n=1 Tax=Methylobacterium haplocladii TaxID=1176176 RepID=A0A512IQF2_9HYPH|nr:glycosyl transferase [Methylobacterium haplocladii]GLS59660.1 glycosyl transferase [Methylobacterium haplocladii]